MDEVLAQKLLEHRRPAALDVHRVAAHKVDQMARQLRGAVGVRAAHGRGALLAHNGAAARRARVGQMVRHSPRRVGNDGDDFGDDLAGLAQTHGVADADILFGNEVLVVQGGAADGRAREQDRLEHGRRR